MNLTKSSLIASKFCWQSHPNLKFCFCWFSFPFPAFLRLSRLLCFVIFKVTRKALFFQRSLSEVSPQWSLSKVSTVMFTSLPLCNFPSSPSNNCWRWFPIFHSFVWPRLLYTHLLIRNYLVSFWIADRIDFPWKYAYRNILEFTDKAFVNASRWFDTDRHLWLKIGVFKSGPILFGCS